MTEAKNQMAFVAWCERNGLLCFAPTPELNRRATPQQLAYAKRMGSKKGIPDLFVFLGKGRLLGIEFKSSKGKVQPAQAMMHENLAKLGVNTAVVRSYAEAKDAVKIALLVMPGFDIKATAIDFDN